MKTPLLPRLPPLIPLLRFRRHLGASPLASSLQTRALHPVCFRLEQLRIQRPRSRRHLGASPLASSLQTRALHRARQQEKTKCPNRSRKALRRS